MIQIVSPHIDDALLSLGGNIQKWKQSGEEVHIYYVFSISDWTNENAISGLKYEKDRKKVTAIRKEEESRISKELGYSYECFDFLDLPLRKDESVHETTVELENLLNAKLDRDSITFFPLGSGHEEISHPDHRLCYEAGVKLKEKGCNIAFYEDLPYMATEDLINRKSTGLTQMGLKSVLTEVDMEEKRRLFNMYASQVGKDWDMLIHSYSYSMQDNLYYERFWE